MAWLKARGQLFRKYVVYFALLVSATLIASGGIGVYFYYQENKTALTRLQQEKAAAAAYRIEQYVKEIEHQIGWTVLPVGTTPPEQLRFDYLRLLRQVPAITDVSLLDPAGQERLRVSRLAMDVADSRKDFSNDPRFIEVRSGRTFFSPVYFRKETEPYMTIFMPASREDAGAGVTVVEVNLKFIWDVVSEIKIGAAGYAYVVDAHGRLVAHPDISLVLQKTDFSGLRQVQAAGAPAGTKQSEVAIAHDRTGREVLTAAASIPALNWFVFVEQPLEQAFAPLYALIARIGLLLLLGLVLSVIASFALARRMVTPIQALQIGAAQIGSGALDHRLKIRTGDELESLAEQFNHMAAQLQESYANLEQKIEDRTRQLELANQAKSRFLAAASHDLRQPMHALGLFVAQLREMISFPEARRVVDQAEASAAAMEQLLNALLDISKLDAGILTPHLEDFGLNALLARLRNNFAPVAAAKGLRLRAVPSRLVVRSDPVLLERIMMNLVSNAVRYTARGGVVIGCRRRGTNVRIEVWDSGLGIPENKRKAIFQEFFQLTNPERDRSKGLGLGLAIVERLTQLLEHRIDLRSIPGKGSVFAVDLPAGDARRVIATPRAAQGADRYLRGAFVVIVDDEALVRDGMRGLLTGWGCHVLDATSGNDVLAKLAAHERIPDLIVSDFRLREGETGIDVIRRLHAALAVPVPSVLISGDTAPERLREATASGYYLLHKPLQPAKLRAMLSYLLANAAQDRAQA